MLIPLIPIDHCCKDTFTFINDVQEARIQHFFFVHGNFKKQFLSLPVISPLVISQRKKSFESCKPVRFRFYGTFKMVVVVPNVSQNYQIFAKRFRPGL